MEGVCVFLITIHKLEHKMDGRIMILDVPIKDFHLCLVNTYGPNNSTPIFFYMHNIIIIMDYYGWRL